MGIRKFLVGLVAFQLLIWGPIDPAWPFMLVIRIAYLVAIPVAAWFGLRIVWHHWQPDAAAEDRLARTLAGAIAGALLVEAILTAQRAITSSARRRFKRGTERSA